MVYLGSSFWWEQLFAAGSQAFPHTETFTTHKAPHTYRVYLTAAHWGEDLRPKESKGLNLRPLYLPPSSWHSFLSLVSIYSNPTCEIPHRLQSLSGSLNQNPCLEPTSWPAHSSALTSRLTSPLSCRLPGPVLLLLLHLSPLFGQKMPSLESCWVKEIKSWWFYYSKVFTCLREGRKRHWNADLPCRPRDWAHKQWPDRMEKENSPTTFWKLPRKPTPYLQ